MAATASKPKGTISIYFDERYQKFHARIYSRGHYLHVGRFANKKDAEEKAARELDRMPEPRPIPVKVKPLDPVSQEVSNFLEELSASGVV